MMRSSVDLPPPLGPEQGGELPGRDADADVVERDEVAEALADVGHLDAQREPSLGRMNDTITMQATDTEGQQERGGVGASLVEVQVLLLDHERGGAGVAQDVARHDLHGAELAERARQAEDDAVDDAPLDGRERDAPERLERAGTEAVGGLLLLDADLLRARAPPRGSRGGAPRTSVARTMPGRAKITWKPSSSSGGPNQPSRPPYTSTSDQPDDDGGHGERDVDERAEEPAAGELVAHEEDRHADAEDRVDAPRPRSPPPR